MYHPIHRALVTFVDNATGEIRVKIPSLIGESEVNVSKIGRKYANNKWAVPAVGDQIVVTGDDEHMTNVFWLHTDTYTEVPDYGVFIDTAIQPTVGIDFPNLMMFRTMVEASNVSIVDNHKITVSKGGVYNIQFSAQLDKTDSGEDHVDIWFRRNGVDEPWSNTRLTLTKNNIKLLAAWNYVVSLNSGDYMQLVWSSDDATMRLYAEPASTSPAKPGIPSTILTVTRVV